MNINNDTNVVVLTGLVSKIEKVQQSEGFLLEVELIVKKKIKTGPKLNRFKVVFFDDSAVDVERCISEGDRVSIVGELDEATHYTGDLGISRETRVTGRHVNVPGLEF